MIGSVLERTQVDRLPAGLPGRIEGPAAWYGPEIAGRHDWLETLAPQEIDEIRAAARGVVARGLDLARLAPGDVPLPRFQPRLARIVEDVLHGRGFALLRGLPVHDLSMPEIAAAYLGIGAHIGSPRSQNGKGHLLGHVRDLGLSTRDPAVRIYQTTERQTFHTDSCDIVALLCLKTAKAGGLSALVSAMTVYNEFRARRPDLLHHLFEPIATDRRGEVPEGMAPFFSIPVLSWFAGSLTVLYQRQYVDSAQRFAEAPRLTPERIEALDLFDALANDSALNLFMEFRPGDVQLVCNHVLLHDRTRFEDWPEPGRKRHLLRLWLAARAARPLPPVFAERYGSVEIGNRGGIVVKGTRLTVPLEPA